MRPPLPKGRSSVLSSTSRPARRRGPQRSSSVAVIDELFDDDDLYRSPVTIEMNASQAYVNPDSPMALMPNEIRGVHAPFIRRWFANGLIGTTPSVHKCDYFSAYYFPPWCVVSAGRKSRPSIVSVFFSGEQHNGVPISQMDTKPRIKRRSKNPMDYAYWRTYITRDLKHALFNSFKTINDAPDGVYLFRSRKVGVDSTEIQKNVDKTVKSTIKMLNNGNRMNWVDTINSKLNVRQLNRELNRNFRPSATVYPKDKWNM